MNTCFTKVLLAIVIACASCGTATRIESNSQDEEIDIGYGTTTRKRNTNSVSKLKVKDEEMASYTSIFEYLRGRVAGVVVEGEEVYIRGVSTIYGNTQPAFIVDGLEVSSIKYLNPMDVDTITVLKDASASIYGVRGANGAILITTKH